MGQHHPILKPGKVNNRDCRVCARRVREMRKRHLKEGGLVGLIKHTNYSCVQCGVPLCIEEMNDQGRSISNCFNVWHHNVEYWRA